MTTAIFSHPICEVHNTGHNHPEAPDRLRALLSELKGPDFSSLLWKTAPKAHGGQLARAHDGAYVRHVLDSVPKTGLVDFEPGGTVMSPDTGEAALRAAGAACAAVDAVMTGEINNAFCAVRPPGHHAEPKRGMGFCFFNNAAIGALHARIAHQAQRISVIDFDVHHGNGTQEIFRNDPDAFFASTHQSFLFPNTGRANEVVPDNIVNVQLARGMKGDVFRELFSERIAPRLKAFNPDFMVISAGFDADFRDPLGGLGWTTEDYIWVTEELTAIADDCCSGRVVSVMEGGYSPRAVAVDGAAHVRVLMEAGNKA